MPSGSSWSWRRSSHLGVLGNSSEFVGTVIPKKQQKLGFRVQFRSLSDVFVDDDHELDSEESVVEQPLVDLSHLTFLPATCKRFFLRLLVRKRPSGRQVSPEGRNSQHTRGNADY